ncbi:MAG: histidine kinase, partial [Chloroflexota bacterium]|nr:histidine kinase [Chloroflexota bacterium]
VYMLIAGGLGALLQASGDLLISLISADVVAVMFQPLRDRLQRGVNHLMYGERDDPYSAISRLGQRLEAAFQPSVILPTIVETVAQALKLPYAAISLKQDGEMIRAAQYGTARGELLRIPLTYAGEDIGELSLAPRAVGEAFSVADRNLLGDLARHAGVAAYGVRLNLDLDRSRRRVVEAREEARRRLGNDLHDGTGHRLAALMRRLERVSGLLRTSPAEAEAALADARNQAKAVIGEVRSLAHTLHPPDLELLGLSEALRERAAAFNSQEPCGLRVTVEVPEQLPLLPISSEAAAYYIAQEALTNVTKHAGASHCHVSLRIVNTANAEQPNVASMLLDGTMLELEITDDGRGLDMSGSREETGRWKGREGLGLHSMRERATELGGSLVSQSPAESGRGGRGGTSVRALLPARIDI